MNVGLFHLVQEFKGQRVAGMKQGHLGVHQTGSMMLQNLRTGEDLELCLETMTFHGAKEVCLTLAHVSPPPPVLLRWQHLGWQTHVKNLSMIRLLL